MGIPFFLTGQRTYSSNAKKLDTNIGLIARMENYKIGREATELFNTGPTDDISELQQAYTKEELGLNEKITVTQLATILRTATQSYRYRFINVPLFWLVSVLKYVIPKRFAYWVYKQIHNLK